MNTVNSSETVIQEESKEIKTEMKDTIIKVPTEEFVHRKIEKIKSYESSSSETENLTPPANYQRVQIKKQKSFERNKSFENKENRTSFDNIIGILKNKKKENSNNKSRSLNLKYSSNILEHNEK